MTNVDDYLVRLIKGCVEMRMAPRMLNRVNMCPVDFVASAIVEISAKPAAFGKCFHFVNPSTYVGLLFLAIADWLHYMPLRFSLLHERIAVQRLY